MMNLLNRLCIPIIAQWANVGIFRISSLLSVLPSLGFVLFGLIRISKAAYDLLSEKKEDTACLESALKGIEFFFLAPLAYLVLRIFAELFEDLNESSTLQKVTRELMIETKAMVVSLLIAVLTVNFLAKVLVESGKSVQLSDHVVSLILLVLLIAYYFGLEFLSMSIQRMPETTKSNTAKSETPKLKEG